MPSTTLESPVAAASAENQIGVEGLFLGASVERVNIVDGGKRFKCWFMTPGVVDYTDVDGGKELIRKPAIDESLNSLVGCPLTIGHIPTNLTSFEDCSNGTIDKVGFDAEKGWHYCEGTIDTEYARAKIEAGWGVSVGTRVRRADYAGPGFWLNNQYDREITKLKFHHLALVEPGKKPRFEDAEIVRTNSTKTPMFKWIRRIAGAAAGDQPTEQASTIAPDTKLDIGDGKSATVQDLVEVARNNAVHAVGDGDFFEHEGVRYNCGDCVKAYRDKMNMGHHGAAVAERANATEETPEAKTAREAKEKDDKSKADAAELERSNAAKATEEAEKLKKDEADKLAETERQNAVAEKAKKDAEAEKARLAAKQAKDAEVERENAARKSGAESFAVLGSARERRSVPIVASVASGSMEAKLARGKKLFGSN